jgi:hypothetical protein
MLKKIFNLLKESTSDRVNSPILRTFFSFWLVVNWKIPLILFFDNVNIEEKIKIIENLSNTFNGVIYPFVYTAIFLLLYPFLKTVVEVTEKNAEKKSKIISHKIECEILNSEKSVIIANKINKGEKYQKLNFG